MNMIDDTILKTCHLPKPRREQVALELGMSPTRYHQRLVELLADPEAEQTYPTIVHQQRRLAAQRKAARAWR